MSSDARDRPAPRARPVADAPVERLVERADELARRWGVALAIARPLERIGEIPFEDLAREAPAVCAQAVRALASDAELYKLAGSGQTARASSPPASVLGALAGAADAPGAVEALEALRGVLWTAALEELTWSPFDAAASRVFADLGDRVAHVCSVALAYVLAEGAPVTVRPLAPAPPPAAEEPWHAPLRFGHSSRGAVLVDELEEAIAPGSFQGQHTAGARTPSEPQPVVGPSQASRRPTVDDARRTRARALPWDLPLGDDRGDRGDRGDDAVMHITRRPPAPADEPA